MSKLGRQDLDG